MLMAAAPVNLAVGVEVETVALLATTAVVRVGVTDAGALVTGVSVVAGASVAAVEDLTSAVEDGTSAAVVEVGTSAAAEVLVSPAAGREAQTWATPAWVSVVMVSGCSLRPKFS
jgi:hypothetical protein